MFRVFIFSPILLGGDYNMKKVYVLLYRTTAGIDGVALNAYKNRNDAETAKRELESRDYIMRGSVKIRVLALR